jgi:hypothetical protein
MLKLPQETIPLIAPTPFETDPDDVPFGATVMVDEKLP